MAAFLSILKYAALLNPAVSQREMSLKTTQVVVMEIMYTSPHAALPGGIHRTARPTLVGGRELDGV